MKKGVYLMIGLWMATLPALSQDIPSIRRARECATRAPSTPLLVDESLMQHRSSAVPLMLKIFVHVFANDNGTNLAAEDTTVMRQINNMRDFYAPHNICFILAGYEEVNNTDLNNHDLDNEESELFPFLVDDCINIFAHRVLVDGNGDTFNGNAYDIPNYYFSLHRNALISIDNRSTMAHEMGHCLGLYHTFEDAFGAEQVPRSGSCVNCTSAGDLLCDTDADLDVDDSEIDPVDCDYTGNATLFCFFTMTFNPYIMEPRNIMTYGRRSCRDHFTSGQGTRAVIVIANTSFLTETIAPASIAITSPASYGSGRLTQAAQNMITVNTSSFSVSGSARVNLNADRVTISPGANFAPGNTGYVSIRHNTICD